MQLLYPIMSDHYMGYSLSYSPMLFTLTLQVHAYTLKPFSLVPDVDALVRVNPSSTNLLKEVTVNDMGRIECNFRLTMHAFCYQQSTVSTIIFIDESIIQLLIQGLYSLPVPYSSQRSVIVDTYTGSQLYPALLEALTPMHTTGKW